MTHRYTKDDNKRSEDNQAMNQLKNEAELEIKQKGKQPYSKKPDHL
ncbi:hypothetical protein ACFQ4X_05020 [Fictibacillus halophilus]